MYNTRLSTVSYSKYTRYWCRRGESNDTRLLILRNLLQTYERKNRTTRCMPASYVQNHVQQIGRGSLFNTVSDASGYSVRTGGFARYRDLSSQVSPRATIFRVTKERWAQIGITTEFLIVARTLSEFFRLRHALGTNFSTAVATPYVGGGLIAACSCWAAVTLYFFRRYTLSAWIALATVPILLVYKIAVIGR